MSGVLKTGQRTNVWLRSTLCFRQICGAWLATHEHVSVPADIERGNAALELRP
jgi:ketosteroid isomerase-like protein